MAYKSTTVKKIMSTPMVIKSVTRPAQPVKIIKSSLMSKLSKPSREQTRKPPLPTKPIQSFKSGSMSEIPEHSSKLQRKSPLSAKPVQSVESGSMSEIPEHSSKLQRESPLSAKPVQSVESGSMSEISKLSSEQQQKPSLLAKPVQSVKSGSMSEISKLSSEQQRKPPLPAKPVQCVKSGSMLKLAKLSSEQQKKPPLPAKPVQCVKSGSMLKLPKLSSEQQRKPPLPAKPVQIVKNGSISKFPIHSGEQQLSNLQQSFLTTSKFARFRKFTSSQETQRRDTIDELEKKLIETSNENLILRKKMEKYNEAFEETKSNLITCIGNLRTEKHKLKQDYLDAVNERDDYFESLKEVEEKYEKTSSQFKKLKSECDARSLRSRQEEVHRSLVESNLFDQTKVLEMELDEKEKNMEKLRSKNELLEKSIEKYKEVNQVQLDTIESLKENIKGMETRAQCWINRNVRDTFETKINHLEQVVERLKTDKRLLSDEYKKAAAENSEQATQREKYITRLQSYMDEQQKLINLMRKIKFKPSKFDQTSTMNSIFLKFEDEQKMRQDLEKLIQENYALQKRNVEYKKIFDSHPFKQLFISY